MYQNEVKNLKELYNLGQEEKNEEIIKDCEDKIEKSLIDLIKKNEINCFLIG